MHWREGGREGGREGERERERESYAYHLEVTLRMWTQKAQKTETMVVIYTVTVYCMYVLHLVEANMEPGPVRIGRAGRAPDGCSEQN